VTRSSIPVAPAYHSAHKPPIDARSVERWSGPGCLAFVHDILSTPALPGEYVICDVLVADLPWQRGYETFNERAGVDDGRTYATFMQRVAELVEATDVPTYLITGKHALSRLPTPAMTLPMMLNEWEAIAICYRPGSEADGRYGVAPEFLHALAQRYAIAGDFCAGYGRTGRFFLRAGKRAVLSDLNPQCIGYIAEHADAWVRDLRR
jgi:hypothetical protein